ncbi:hypothetical protein [Streptomyces sp. NPDC018352]|uniref:hypothetical protein n=1 Tax=Streptomyces sp. NPDC018352 TaxID=3157194 RepID=UPI0033DE4FE4
MNKATYERVYTDLLGIVARLDGLRGHGGRNLDPAANAAMHACGCVAWALWRARHRELLSLEFADQGRAVRHPGSRQDCGAGC